VYGGAHVDQKNPPPPGVSFLGAFEMKSTEDCAIKVRALFDRGPLLSPPAS